MAPTSPAVLRARTAALRGRRQTTPQHKPSSTLFIQAYPAMTLATRLVERHQTAHHRLHSSPGRCWTCPYQLRLVNLTADCTASQVWLSGMTGVTAGPARTLKSIGIMLILSPEIDSTPQNCSPNPPLSPAAGADRFYLPRTKLKSLESQHCDSAAKGLIGRNNEKNCAGTCVQRGLHGMHVWCCMPA